MPDLIAKVPILHLAKLYQPGDKLPLNDIPMKDAWLEAGSAAWDEDPEKEPEKEVTEEATEEEAAEEEEKQEAPGTPEGENAAASDPEKKSTPKRRRASELQNVAEGRYTQGLS